MGQEKRSKWEIVTYQWILSNKQFANYFRKQKKEKEYLFKALVNVQHGITLLASSNDKCFDF